MRRKDKPAPKISAAEKRSRRTLRRRGEMFNGEAQRNIFGGIEYLDPARKRPELEPPQNA